MKRLRDDLSLVNEQDQKKPENSHDYRLFKYTFLVSYYYYSNLFIWIWYSWKIVVNYTQKSIILSRNDEQFVQVTVRISGFSLKLDMLVLFTKDWCTHLQKYFQLQFWWIECRWMKLSFATQRNVILWFGGFYVVKSNFIDFVFNRSFYWE